MPTSVDTSGWKLPINLGLNDGTYCSQAAIDVLQGHDSRTALRNYSDGDNSELLGLIAQECGVTPSMVFVHNGSGPILKQVMPFLIKQYIKKSPSRVFKHLVAKNGFPIITPTLTYFKVPLNALKRGLDVRLFPLHAEHDYRMQVEDLEAALKKGDGLVYLATPNNPTGTVQIKRDDLVRLLEAYPNSLFWIDEAYVQYVDPSDHQYCVDLVAKYPNMVCTRTFSFAYGMAAARIGYIVAREEWVSEWESQVTNYRIPLLTERMGVATLRDGQHLPDLRERSQAARDLLTSRMHGKWGKRLKVYPSQANFVLVETLDGEHAKKVAAGLLERGVKIKTFVPVKDQTYGQLFRITIGTPDENEYCMDMLDEVMALI